MFQIGKEHVLVVVGLFESFFYSGLVLGWASLNLLLKKEGVFSHLCEKTNGNITAENINATTTSPVFYINDFYKSPPYYERAETLGNQTEAEAVYLSCPDQAKMLNLAYNIAVSVGAFAGFLWGILLDKYGIRALRLVISFCLSGGTVLLMFTTKDLPYMLFISMTMCSFVGIAVRLSCLQISELFPRQRSTLITLYSGANTASASVFTILKIFYDQGATWKVTVGIFLGLSLVALPATFLLFPARNFNKITENKNNKAKVTQSVEQLEVQEKPPPEVGKEVEERKQLPLSFSIFSISSLLYNFWIAWLMLFGFYYNGSMHLWVSRSSNDPEDLDTYVDILGISQLGALVLGPLSGFLIDLNLSRVPKPNVDAPKRPTASGDHADYDETINQIRATFWMAFLTTCLLGAVQICKFFDTKTAIIASIVVYILFRSAVMGVSITYMRQRFPREHYNKLVGITASFRSICFLLQFPMFVWDTEKPGGVSIFNMGCLAVAFILPLHMKTRLLPWLMKREDKAANKIQNWDSKEVREAAIISTTL